MNYEFKERTQFLGKHIGILFWLFVPRLISGLMGNSYMQVHEPGVYNAGTVLCIICFAVYVIVLLKLTRENRHYRDAGLFSLVSIVLSIIVMLILSGDVIYSSGTSVLALIGEVSELCAEYQEFTAHAEQLESVAGDKVQADKWRKLWTKFMICYLVLIGSLLLAMMIPFVGMIIMLISAIAVVVFSIMKIVYLYRTSKIFMNCEEPQVPLAEVLEEAVAVVDAEITEATEEPEDIGKE